MMAQKPKTVGELLLSQKKQIEAALPRHMTADRMLRVIMTEIRRIPKLAECSQASLMSAIIQCSQLGLEPGLIGHAYLIPFDRNIKNPDGKTWSKIKECQLIIGYKGMLDLARRSGQVVSVSVHAVYANDKFEYAFGLNEKCEHQPARGDRGDFFGAYAIVKLKDGAYQFDFMFKEEIDKIRASSKAKDNGPWVTNYEEMAKKTVIRRLFKYLPISIEIQQAVALDEAAERGENSNYIDVDFEPTVSNEFSAAESAKSLEENIDNKEFVTESKAEKTANLI